ncbi:MAG: hypothetical protein C0483_20040 [Pirellula sp.]|nr:hypothetical protein [Pirellula sp.]
MNPRAPNISRRALLQTSALALAGGYTTSALGRAASTSLRCASFHVDVTPPLGHPTIGGSWRPATGIDDPLSALGIVLLGGDRPIVVACLDWCELRNETYLAWREALAEAVETKIDHVFLSCVHQHDAPYVDTGAQRILDAAGAGRAFCDPWFDRIARGRTADAVARSLAAARPLTHIGLGQAEVRGVASSRRVLKPDGTPYFGRFSACSDPRLRAQPEGEIDPLLKSVTLYDGAAALATLHAYAVHPMSPYGRGMISGDFVGLARARRQASAGDSLQIYATGCCGDVTAGKFNDGSAAVRGRLTDALHDAMVRSERSTERFAIDQLAARSEETLLPFWNGPGLDQESMARRAADEKLAFGRRVDAALGLSSLEFNMRDGGSEGHHALLQTLQIGPAHLALFPAESFVAFQRAVQSAAPDAFTMCIGFGECAPGYIPTRQAVQEGFREEHGYCWVDETAEDRIVGGMLKLLKR